MAAQLRGRAANAAGATLTPGQHLRAEMQRLGFDQVSLSAALGVSRQAINNIVNGRQPISRAMAGKLGRVTGRTSDYWLQQDFAASGRRAARGPRRAGVLVRQQILRAVEDGVIGITPFDRAQVRAASLELTLRAGIKLKRGELAVAVTRERVEMPVDCLGRLGTTAALAARGIVGLQAAQIEPGFKGSVSVSLFNAGRADVPLGAGEPVVSLEIVALAAAPAQGSPVRAERVK